MRRVLYIVLLLFPALQFVACGDAGEEKENRQRADFLYELVADNRYKNVASLDSVARELLLLNVSNEYNAVAKNALAYAALMRMDYKAAKKLYADVANEAHSEIERLTADVGMMTLCYRLSGNRDFFDYRTSALRRMRRIQEETSLPSLARNRFESAKIEFNIVSICYFSNIGLVDELSASALYLKEEAGRCNDATLRLYARMMLTNVEDTLSERAEAYAVGGNIASSRGLVWLAANYKLLLAITLRSVAQQDVGGAEVAMSEGATCGEEALLAALDAVKYFSLYGDGYMKIEALAVAASCNTWLGRYYEALALIDEAVADINDYYKGGDFFALDTFAYIDDTELVPDEQQKNIYECLLSVRREASCAYAGLGDKELSDINREAYLNLLRTTRMNKKMESRIEDAADNAVRLYWWSMLAFVAFVGVALFLFLMNRRLRAHNRIFTYNLKKILYLSRKLMSSLPLEMSCEEDVCRAVCDILGEGYRDFPFSLRFSLLAPFEQGDENPFVYGFSLPLVNGVRSYTLYMAASCAVPADKLSVVEMSLPYVAVALEEGLRMANISDEQLRIEEQRLSHAIYLSEHKRENLLKRVSVSILNGMRPYMDRLLNELRLLPRSEEGAVAERRLHYVAELTEKLGDYNIILERWIKMRRGELSLHIECFSLSELFEIIAKSGIFFDARGIRLNVKKSDAVVRADRALTLFMINTLVDNAGKFTPSGGEIVVEAVELPDCVEIAVEDTGVGLSAGDIDSILNDKVYDASLIGADDASFATNKGGGFGLMNCKGIIEKYKNFDDIFGVCSLGIKSEKGRGSRFSFRLPRGVVRCVLFLFALLVPLGAFCNDDCLERVGECADSVFMANVSGDYEKAFLYATQGINALNEYYSATIGGVDTLALSSGSAAELRWWRDELFSPELKEDIFFNILDIRNELAVASLALQRWPDYRYNDAIYASLYRLVHEDKGLEDFYEQTMQIVNYRQAAIALLFFFILLVVVAYVAFYVRHGIVERMNSRMLLDLNRRLSAVSGSNEQLSADELAQRIVSEIYAALHESMCVERVSLLLKCGEELTVAASCRQGHDASIYMRSVAENGVSYFSPDGLLRVLPLFVVSGGEKSIVGSLEFVSERAMGENEALNVELIARYVASVAYHSMVRMAENYRCLAEAEQEAEQVKFEENRLHVQNLVMDNCFSMIKHETIYYPGRVRVLVEQAIALGGNCDARRAKIADMCELMEYYNSIFTILSNCAIKQMDEISFKKLSVSVNEAFEQMQHTLARRARKKGLALVLEYEPTALVVAADRDMLSFLFDSLADAMLCVEADGELCLRAVDCGDVVRVELCDKRRKPSRDCLYEMFVPSKNNLADDGGLQGMELLVVKEIVRLHEDYLQVRGGRVEARVDDEGLVIMFTLPKNVIL